MVPILHQERKLITTTREFLYPLGFDLVQPFDLSRYNNVIMGRSDLLVLPDFGRQSPLALLIGNTRHLWTIFQRAFQGSPELQGADDPLDLYTSRTIRRLCEQFECLFSAHLATDDGERRVSMTELARVSALAHLGPAHLAIHPVHGPWFALRAVICLDRDAGARASTTPTDWCSACEAPCLNAFQQALQHTPSLTTEAIAERWQQWAEVRQVCPVGTTSAYSRSQLEYHYTKKRRLLTGQSDI